MTATFHSFVAAWKQFLLRYSFPDLGVPDYIFIAFLLAGLFYGVRRGLLRTLVDLPEFCIVMFFTLLAYKPFSTLFGPVIQGFPPHYAEFASFFIVLPTVIAAVKYVDAQVAAEIFKDELSRMEKFLGAILGLLYFTLITATIYRGVALIPGREIAKFFRIGNSATGHFLVELPNHMYLAVISFFEAIASIFTGG